MYLQGTTGDSETQPANLAERDEALAEIVASRERYRVLGEVAMAYHETFDATMTKGIRGSARLEQITGADRTEVQAAVVGLSQVKALQAAAKIALEKAQGILVAHGLQTEGEAA